MPALPLIKQQQIDRFKTTLYLHINYTVGRQMFCCMEGNVLPDYNTSTNVSQNNQIITLHKAHGQHDCLNEESILSHLMVEFVFKHRMSSFSSMSNQQLEELLRENYKWETQYGISDKTGLLCKEVRIIKKSPSQTQLSSSQTAPKCQMGKLRIEVTEIQKMVEKVYFFYGTLAHSKKVEGIEVYCVLPQAEERNGDKVLPVGFLFDGEYYSNSGNAFKRGNYINFHGELLKEVYEYSGEFSPSGQFDGECVNYRKVKSDSKKIVSNYCGGMKNYKKKEEGLYIEFQDNDEKLFSFTFYQIIIGLFQQIRSKNIGQAYQKTFNHLLMKVLGRTLKGIQPIVNSHPNKKKMMSEREQRGRKYQDVKGKDIFSGENSSCKLLALQEGAFEDNLKEGICRCELPRSSYVFRGVFAQGFKQGYGEEMSFGQTLRKGFYRERMENNKLVSDFKGLVMKDEEFTFCELRENRA